MGWIKEQYLQYLAWHAGRAGAQQSAAASQKMAVNSGTCFARRCATARAAAVYTEASPQLKMARALLHLIPR